jgi:hypothetical protein
MTNAIARATIILVMVCCWQAYGDSITFTVDPVSGDVSGAPGTTVGWGFTIDNTTDDSLFLDGTFFCEAGEDPVVGPDFTCGPNLGASTYTDIVASNTGIIGPGVTTQVFDGVSNGVGAYSIDPLATVGETDSGTLVVLYDLVDPSFNDIAQNLELTAAVSVTVTPEPNTALPLAGALLIGAFFIRKRRHAA